MAFSDVVSVDGCRAKTCVHAYCRRLHRDTTTTTTTATRSDLSGYASGVPYPATANQRHILHTSAGLSASACAQRCDTWHESTSLTSSPPCAAYVVDSTLGLCVLLDTVDAVDAGNTSVVPGATMFVKVRPEAAESFSLLQHAVGVAGVGGSSAEASTRYGIVVDATGQRFMGVGATLTNASLVESLSVNSAFTIAFTVLVASNGGYVLAKTGPTGLVRYYAVYVTPSGRLIVYYQRNGNTVNDREFIAFDTALTDGRVHRVTVTVDASLATGGVASVVVDDAYILRVPLPWNTTLQRCDGGDAATVPPSVLPPCVVSVGHRLSATAATGTAFGLVGVLWELQLYTGVALHAHPPETRPIVPLLPAGATSLAVSPAGTRVSVPVAADADFRVVVRVVLPPLGAPAVDVLTKMDTASNTTYYKLTCAADGTVHFAYLTTTIGTWHTAVFAVGGDGTEPGTATRTAEGMRRSTIDLRVRDGVVACFVNGNSLGARVLAGGTAMALLECDRTSAPGLTPSPARDCTLLIGRWAEGAAPPAGDNASIATAAWYS